MRPLNKVILFALIAAFFTACNKEELPTNSTVGQPVFSFNGTIGGNNLSLKAGVNNYYMYSSFVQDSVGHDTVVYGFTGNLQSTSTNKNSIQITINDYKVSLKNISVSNHIDSSFSQVSYKYYNSAGDTTGYLVKFTPVIYHGSALAFTYSFGDGSPNITETSNTSIVHTYISTTTTYTSSLNVDFNSCGHVIDSNPISILNVPSPLTIDSIYSTPGHDSANLYPVTFTGIISNGTAPYTYSWNFGDGSSTSVSSTSLNSTVTHTYNSLSTFTVNLTVTDYSAKSQSYNYTVWDSSGYTGCLMDYRMSVPLPIIATSYPLSEITIVYIDPSGNVYTSKNPVQPVSSSFQVLSVANYKNNMNNELTKEVTVRFNCTLYNTISGPPISASGTAVIAVAYQ